MNITHVFIKASSFLMLSMLIFSCGGKPVQTSSPEYKVKTLDTTTAVVYTEYSTIIQSNTLVEIRPKVSGYLVNIAKQEGNTVRKGELIFKIDDSDYQQDVNAAKASVEAAKAKRSNASLEVRKLTPLVEKGIISPYELETAKSDLVAADASLQQAQAQYENSLITLGYTEIKSPVDGVLGRIYVREGSLISPSSTDALTTVSSDGDVYAYFSYDEKELNPVRREALKKQEYQPEKAYTVELVLAGGGLYGYKGRLENATGIIDRSTGSIQLKVIFPNPDFGILSGASGVLRFPYSYHGCITIPQSSTYEMQDKIMIFSVNADSTVTRKTIAVEGISGNDYVVTNVERGTRIVTEGVDKLKEGMKITPKEE